jgi:diacylglycerol kinase (ATP)
MVPSEKEPSDDGIHVSPPFAGLPSPSEAVLVTSPHAGRSRKLASARRALDEDRIRVVEELAIEHLDRLPELLRTQDGLPRLVIAAGGDGTVGSVAGRLAGAENPLGILPLGTGNDFARSLDIPLNPRRAARLLGTGEISRVDLARLTRPAQPPRYFAHAATVGLNVDFAKLATRASIRARLGRLTYLAAAVYAVRDRSTFRCTLQHDGVAQEFDLLQLSVISAPVIGGALGLSVRGPHRDEPRLDVLAVEDVSPLKMLRAGLVLLTGINRSVPGVRALQVQRLGVDSPRPLGLSLDGELDGTIPGQFEVVAGAARVIVPVARYRPAEGRAADGGSNRS